MGVNFSFGINPNNTKHLGKLFHTIDYETENGQGYLIIDKSRFKINQSELKELHFNNRPGQFKKSEIYMFKGIELNGNEYGRLCETLKLAYVNITKKIKMGL